MKQTRRTLAIIGSFRQHYEKIQQAWVTFTSAGIIVSSPLGSNIMQPGIPFVRFETDMSKFDDHSIQTLALHRILRAELVYVVAPDGYVGRTTCYEIGRVIQARHPIYFSETISDLPIRIPAAYILHANELADRLVSLDWKPTWLYDSSGDVADTLERELVNGTYRPD